MSVIKLIKVVVCFLIKVEKTGSQLQQNNFKAVFNYWLPVILNIRKILLLNYGLIFFKLNIEAAQILQVELELQI